MYSLFGDTVLSDMVIDLLSLLLQVSFLLQYFLRQWYHSIRGLGCTVIFKAFQGGVWCRFSFLISITGIHGLIVFWNFILLWALISLWKIFLQTLEKTLKKLVMLPCTLTSWIPICLSNWVGKLKKKTRENKNRGSIDSKGEKWIKVRTTCPFNFIVQVFCSCLFSCWSLG